jgi:O-antigen ligase
MNFGEYYEPERITGFMSHWMTFGGEEMFVLIMLTAYLFFSPSARKRGFWFVLLCFGLLCAALLLGWTRSIWIATAVAGLYLIWFRKRWLIALVPVILAAAFLAGPDFVRTRMHSVFQAHDRAFRVVTWRTGFRMIQAHPWLGLGPEQIKPNNPEQRVSEIFKQYLPPDVHEPLPEGWYGHLHNIFLQYAAERGIPAMLAVLWMLLMMLTDFWRALRRLPPGPSDRRFVLHGAIAVIIATMVAGMFEHNLGDSEVLTMFLVVAACGYVAAEKEPAVA